MEAISKIYKGAIELVDNTPLAEVTNTGKKEQLKVCLLVKLEYFSPAGGVKDRVGRTMIKDAEHTGRLKPGSVIIELIPGNIDIGLTVVSAVKGYRMILTIPGTMNVKRHDILKTYGAEVVLTPSEKGMSGAIEETEELAKEIPDSFIPDQFGNPVNPRVHMESTGPGIWRDTDGQADIFTVSVGTGSTLTGTGTYLKEKNPRIRIIVVEPSTSVVLSGKSAGPHEIQGIGVGFIPKVPDTRVYDEITAVDSEAPLTMAEMLVRTEGLFTGISPGAALYAGIEVARRPEDEGKTIVALLPDSGDRYYSMASFVEQGSRMW